EGVEDSSAFEALPSSLQRTVINVLVIARDNLPSMLGRLSRAMTSTLMTVRCNELGSASKALESSTPS
ncbi:hypothetical protein, partial [Aquipseudomonas alcaligenes]|uniref:hypothetical protein n=1 Tax=Aquipseudomonas alcaligenes TaxID=43263 RepID=UPI001C7E70CC